MEYVSNTYYDKLGYLPNPDIDIHQLGGASGIGAETARVFALRGAHVIIAARDVDAAMSVKQAILQCNPAAAIDVLKLDLSSLKSVRAFADNFHKMNLPLNVLM